MEIRKEFIEKAEELQNSREFKTLSIEATPLMDCYILTPKMFGDDRGTLGQIDIEPLEKLGFQGLKKVIESKNPKRGVIRGMHLQEGDSAQTKVVKCTSGKVMDVVVDLREDSPTFCEYTSVELTPENGKSLFVPRGFAHGYLAAEDNTNFLYLVDNYYDKSSEAGISYDDAYININWKNILDKYGIKIDELNFSLKDKNHPTLYELKQLEKELVMNNIHSLINGIENNYLNKETQDKLLSLDKKMTSLEHATTLLKGKKLLLEEK